MPTGGGNQFASSSSHDERYLSVISPLVALHEGQVANLQHRNINIALTGGIRQEEIIDLLDNCQYGNYKFLYLSPEDSIGF
jgi:ATP-dependent DNA helicase RecQ